MIIIHCQILKAALNNAFRNMKQKFLKNTKENAFNSNIYMKVINSEKTLQEIGSNSKVKRIFDPCGPNLKFQIHPDHIWNGG